MRNTGFFIPLRQFHAFLSGRKKYQNLVCNFEFRILGDLDESHIQDEVPLAELHHIPD